MLTTSDNNLLKFFEGENIHPVEIRLPETDIRFARSEVPMGPSISLLDSALLLGADSIQIHNYSYDKHGVVFVNGVRIDDKFQPAVAYPATVSFIENETPLLYFIVKLRGSLIYISSEQFASLQNSMPQLKRAYPERVSFFEELIGACATASLRALRESTWGALGMLQRDPSKATTETAKSFKIHTLRPEESLTIEVVPQEPQHVTPEGRSKVGDMVIFSNSYAGQLKESGVLHVFPPDQVVILSGDFEGFDGFLPILLSHDGVVSIPSPAPGQKILMPGVTLNSQKEGTVNLQAGDTATVTVISAIPNLSVGAKNKHNFRVRYLGNGCYEVEYVKLDPAEA